MRMRHEHRKQSGGKDSRGRPAFRVAPAVGRETGRGGMKQEGEGGGGRPDGGPKGHTAVKKNETCATLHSRGTREGAKGVGERGDPGEGGGGTPFTLILKNSSCAYQSMPPSAYVSRRGRGLGPLEGDVETRSLACVIGRPGRGEKCWVLPPRKHFLRLTVLARPSDF